jgi:hypothetical protein
VRRQTTAPGGATPAHEEIWVPTDDDWAARLREFEEAGKRWDTTPWEISNLRGFGAFVGLGIVVFVVVSIAGGLLGPDAWVRLAAGAAVLLLPIWFNGIRTTWNPSELRLKGECLETARSEAAGLLDGDFEIVPLLAFREGKKGKYPVDAKMMLRPKGDDGSGFLGIQVQVAMNNVQGKDYPYLYCVVLGKEGFRLSRPKGGARLKGRGKRQGRRIVFERGSGDGAEFLVVRQHADRQGGWHTKDHAIGGLVQVAVEEGRKAWEENRG